MKNKKKRKGFTLVELLVVIAILAVLATVAILGYTQFTKKANIANDQAICSQMNLALQSNEALDNKARYAHQAVGQCQDAGFILENLTPSTADFHFAYDQKYNRFMLLEKDFSFNYGDTQHSQVAPNSKENVNVFVVVGNQEEFDKSKQNGFSAYLRTGFDEVVTTLTTDKGIDVGECTKITSIVYDNSEASEGQNVVIRTNSYDTVLTINAEKDTVKHFDKANKVEVIAVAMHSYHEFGDVLGNINLTAGNVVVEEGCKASAVVIDMTAQQLAKVTTLSADNSAEPGVPIILKTSEYLWSVNPHNDLINPEKNNIIYVNFGGTLPANFEAMSVGEKEAAIAAAESTQGIAHSSTTNLTYATLNDAIEVTNTNGTITLLSDVSLNENLIISKNLTFNYAGHSFDFTNGKTFEISESYALKLSNGSLKFSGNTSSTKKTLIVNKNSSLYIENITYETDAAGIIPVGFAPMISIKNSTIRANSYCLSTNAGSWLGTETPIVEINNSDFESTGGTALLLNVPAAKIYIDSSNVKGLEQALFLRQGMAYISNCNFSIDNIPNGEIGYFDNKAWGQGNNASIATIVVGDWSSVAEYHGTCSCDLKNVHLFAGKDKSGKAVDCNVFVAQVKGFSANLDYSDDCIFEGGKVKVTSATNFEKGTITINGQAK